MNEWRKNKFILFTIALLTIFITVGCVQDRQVDLQLLLPQTEEGGKDKSLENAKNEEELSLIKELVYEMPEVYDSAIVKNGKKVIVAYKVKHMKRWHMKSINKRLLEKLEKNFPQEKFIVSSDFKIFLEITRLSNKFERADYDEKEAKKKFKDIAKLSKEET